LLYGDETVGGAPEMVEKNCHYFILKAPTHQALWESYESGIWFASPQIKKVIRELCQKPAEVIAFIVVNGSRHFNGYLTVENDYEEWSQLTPEEAKAKVATYAPLILFLPSAHGIVALESPLDEALPSSVPTNH
jgi:hypothetical protein